MPTPEPHVARPPQARVLKAFNTNFAATLSEGTIHGAVTRVLVAGDDLEAKQALIDAVESAGLRGIDGGGLDRAHAQEQIGIHQIFLAVNRCG